MRNTLPFPHFLVHLFEDLPNNMKVILYNKLHCQHLQYLTLDPYYKTMSKYRDGANEYYLQLCQYLAISIQIQLFLLVQYQLLQNIQKNGMFLAQLLPDQKGDYLNNLDYYHRYRRMSKKNQHFLQRSTFSDAYQPAYFPMQ